ncbi:hypothetical protein NM688_g4547 [Phlebia brevispora]|uniref:Uncharacterized protein n=1 Tax=Phlebia brevispora TaxID=194682 RepID=A0ACC1T2R2_9APHY|nr:hypothetical protein NM688_g4547 [Phlebia brevispora]
MSAMATTADELVEERVAILEEIQKRRNDLLREMYILSKLKDNLGAMVSVNEQDEAGLQTFLSERELTKKPDLHHVAALLDARASRPSTSNETTPTPDHHVVEEQHIVETDPPSENPLPTPPVAAVESPPLTPVPDASEAEEAESHLQLLQQSSTSDAMEVDTTLQSAVSVEAHDQQPPPYSPVGVPSEPRRSASRVPSEPRLEEQAESRASSIHPTIEPSVSTAPPAEQPESKPSPQEERINVEIAMQPANDVARKSATPASRLTPVPSQTNDAAMAPLDMLVHSEPPLPLVRQAPTEYTLSIVPPLGPAPLAFMFKEEPPDVPMEEEEKPAVVPTSVLWKSPTYPLPPLSVLPAEFHKKGKSKQSRRRDKDKSEGKNQEWTPMGIAKWGAVIKANPVYKRMARASKCLSSRDWDIAMTELKLLRTLERMDHLAKNSAWSFRQPKKHRGVGGLTKTHWDYLLDEMKWMRSDFREERKWKLALAYNLAHAVMDWHAAGSKAERERLEICLHWKKPRPEEFEDEQAEMQLDHDDLHAAEIDEDANGDSKSNSTPVNEENSNSDDDSDNEDEREQRAHQEAVEAQTAIDEALGEMETSARSQGADNQSSQDQILPKVEDIEDRSALHRDDAMDVDEPPTSSSPKKTPEVGTKTEESSGKAAGLKSSSDNPILTGTSTPAESHAPRLKTKGSPNSYAPLREKIVYSEPDKLFLDMDDFGLVQGMSELSTDDQATAMPPPPTDLSDIFPDLQLFGMLDVAPPPTEGKKKSERRGDRDDPNKRAEDTTYQKLTPMSEFIYNRTTLVGSLRPSRHWRNAHWQDLDETTIVADSDTPLTRPAEEIVSCSLFDSVKPHSPALPPPHPPASVREIRRRTVYEAMVEGRTTPGGSHHKVRNPDLVWTPQDDMVLKQLIEKWPNNWGLIADAFNSSRLTMASDRRAPSDCYDRWKTRFGGSNEDEARPSQTPTTQMTTRGTKRSMSMSVSASNGNGGSGSHYGSESRKRRRHSVMFETIRKAAKKKEAAQKANAANQRKPAAIHDTHGQYNKMPKYSPAELSRIKAEKDARENREHMILRQRSELEARQLMQRAQQQQQNGQQAAVSDAVLLYMTLANLNCIHSNPGRTDQCARLTTYQRLQCLRFATKSISRNLSDNIKLS